MKKKILIITDRFLNSGNGNYFRSCELHKKLKLVYNCKIVLFSEINKNLIKLNDLIILDLPFKKYNLNFLKNFEGYIISLDHHLKFNIDLNICLFEKSAYAKKNICGLQYAIIREEIKNKFKKKKKNLIFISIGSSDIKNYTHKIYELLKKKYKYIFCSKKLSYKNKINTLNNNKYIHNMKCCSLAITNGGTTMLELLYLNKVVIAFAQNSQERKFINYVKKHYIVFSGFDNLRTNQIKKIINKKQKNGPIKGNAVKLIINEIKKFL